MNKVTSRPVEGGWLGLLRQSWPDALFVVLFLVISFAYFMTPISQGLVLGGDDHTGGVGMAHEHAEYHERTGEITRWTNSVFGGMPTYQIAPSYDSTSALGTIQKIYQLGTTGVLSYTFLFLLGFYILLRAFNFKPYLAALGSILWAFSSYFMIIILAGHIWKVLALCFIPPTIGGLILCYRGKYLWGGAVTALFTALQVTSNHVQMSYYFIFVMLAIVVAYGIAAFLPKKDATDDYGMILSPKSWLKATGIIIVAGMIGVLANVSNLYHTYEYQKHSMRGGSELKQAAPAKADAKTDAKAAEKTSETTRSGLSTEYITQWSYGINESLTLLIPEVSGGSSAESILDKVPEAQENMNFMGGLQNIQQAAGPQAASAFLPSYWGEQPGTSGPVYVGAIVCLLFILGIFYVRGPMKWALLAATIISFFFAWGKNSMALTQFFIDNLPLYNKFRAVSSALVIAEFIVPLLGILALARFIKEPDLLRRKPLGLYIAFGITAGLCLILWLAPGVYGDCINSTQKDIISQLSNAGVIEASSFSAALSDIHHSVLAASAGRSLLFVLLGAAVLFLYSRGIAKDWMMCGALALFCLIDLWQVDKKYLNDNSFSDPVTVEDAVSSKPAVYDEILADNSDYRVADISRGLSNTFNSNDASYWFKNIGGYSPAKMQRYQELIDRYIGNELATFDNAAKQLGDHLDAVNIDSLFPVLNMLNMKYAVVADSTGTAQMKVKNPYANGNGWFVNKLQFVKDADAELSALSKLDTKHIAVADESFKAQLDGTPLDSGTVKLDKYEPNELDYTISSAKGGVVVLSEIYYPGWTATLDGQPVEIGRVNYVLRALKVTPGQHKLHLEFKPASIAKTDTVAYIALALTIIAFMAGLFFNIKDKVIKPKGQDNVK